MKKMFRRSVFFGATLLALSAVTTGQRANAPFELRPGDHISIIGNTLAERMQ